jgi:hypothetical protein
MKNFMYIKCCVFTLFFIHNAKSQVLWYGSPDKPYKDSFRLLNKEPGEAGTAIVINDPTMGKVWSINKPAGSKRTEFARTLGYIPNEGDKVYVGWRVKVNIEGSRNPDGAVVFQLKTEGNGNQDHPVTVGYNGTTITVDGVDPGTGSCISCRSKTFCGKGMKENEWTSIVLGFKFSSNAEVGYVEVWINGVKQNLINDNADKQSKHRTIDTGEMYFKWGAYNENSRDYNITVNMDEMRVAKTYALAEPNNYNNMLSTNDVNLEDPARLSLFPNPNKNGIFNINEKVYWEVHDLLGRIIKKGNSAIIDISNQERGIYIAKIGKNTARKIVFD